MGIYFIPPIKRLVFVYRIKPLVKKGRAWLKLFGYTGEARLCTGITVKRDFTLVINLIILNMP